MSKSVCVPEQVSERKVIVYKSRIDQKEVKSIAEKMKTKLFRKLMFMKPKHEEVQITSIDRYFEQYITVDGEYCIEYSKKWNQNTQVPETMQELTCYGEKIKPFSLKDSLGTPCKIVNLIGEGRHKFVAKAHLIFDDKWEEVGLEKLPLVPFEEQPEKILKMIANKTEDINAISERKEIEILKSKIVQRPEDILCVHNELFKVSDRAIIYKPMYQVTIKNTKTEKEIAIRIDAITGKTKHQQISKPKKKVAKEKKKQPKKPKKPAETVPDKQEKTEKKQILVPKK
jgi:hypothetical protein